MSNAVVPLKRRFMVLNEADDRDPQLLDLAYTSRVEGGLDWERLRAARRVVILAEPGSGKTTELEEQERAVRAAGNFVFATTLSKIGKKGFAAAIGADSSGELAKWLISDQPAWFFLDSVDEAKAKDIRLEEVLADVAEAIRGAEGRAHIVLSGRFSDWEFRRDLRTLEKLTPTPPADLTAAPIDPNELIVKALNESHKPEKAPAAEVPLVVVMAPMDRNQVREFAIAKNVGDVDRFCAELDKRNLWDFARRPLDLDWLVTH